jgi:hypothetical protein
MHALTRQNPPGILEPYQQAVEMMFGKKISEESRSDSHFHSPHHVLSLHDFAHWRYMGLAFG